MFRKILRFWATASLILLIICMFCSCVTKKTTNPTTEPELPSSILTEFKELMPQAILFDYLICDLDKNKIDDYIFLFSESEKTDSITAGLSVYLSNSSWSAIDIASNSNFFFCAEPSLRFDGDITIICIQLKDPRTEKIYYYEVEYSYDSDSKLTNYSIISKQLEQEDGYE